MARFTRAVFADPIHGTVTFDNDPEIIAPLVAVIDHPVFQRLRRISQLGLASFVFPGATHTRFLHGLGAAHLAVEVINHLVRTSDDAGVIAELKHHKVTIVIAALLHDVGHGPFSHAFERVTRKADGKPAVDHELWSTTLVSDVFGDLLRRHSIEPTLVAAMIGKKESDSVPEYVRQIVSSQLDVDRLDYLPRDAHFCGVSLGKIDIGYLIDSLEVVSTGKVRSLGLTSRGVRPYEAFMLARHHMNRCVYFHPKVRVFEFMLETCLSHIITSEYKGWRPDYLNELQHWDASVTPADKFAKNTHKAYGEITESEVWTMIGQIARAGGGIAATMANDLLTRDPLPFYFVRAGLSLRVKEELRFAGLRDHTEVLNAESIAYKKTGAPVLIRGRDDLLEPAQEHSSIVSFHMDRPDGDDILAVMTRGREAEVERTVWNMLDLPVRSGPIGTVRSSRPPVGADELKQVTLAVASTENDYAVEHSAGEQHNAAPRSALVTSSHQQRKP